MRLRAEALKPLLNGTHSVLVSLTAAHEDADSNGDGAVAAPLFVTRLVLATVLTLLDAPLRALCLLERRELFCDR